MNKIKIREDLKIIFSSLFKLKINKVKITINYKNTKAWDSLNHVKLIMALESRFKISINPDVAITLLSFKDIEIFLIKKNVDRIIS
jgi:acyl carrier protein